jgi:hypothetical protein
MTECYPCGDGLSRYFGAHYATPGLPVSLTLVFRSSTVHTVGPLASFRLDGEALRAVDGQVIARHQRNLWQIAGGHYPRLECEGPVSIWFERQPLPEVSRRFGPYTDLAMYDGVAYIGARVFASLNQQSNTWYCHDAGGYWRVMAVESSPA